MPKQPSKREIKSIDDALSFGRGVFDRLIERTEEKQPKAATARAKAKKRHK